jgi:hypothetical protein
VLALAGAKADVVSLNFDNSAGKLGATSVVSATEEQTRRKLDWVQEGAGARFDDLELEIGAYFVAVTDQPQSAAAAIAARFGCETDVLMNHPHALFGSVDTICETLQRRREQFGISYITIAQRNLEDFAPVVARLA